MMMVQESSVFLYVFLDPKKIPSLFLSLFFFVCVDLGFGVYPIFFYQKVGCLFRYLRLFL